MRPRPRETTPLPTLGVRAVVGGILMGLANLVPGISGGTMLLAAGIYPAFIGAIAEVSTLRFRGRSVFVLAFVALAAAAAILFLAGPVRDLVVHHRWIMYSLFVGLTLGGVPVVWRLARPATPAVWAGALVGLAAMASLALLQRTGAASALGGGGFGLLVVAGIAGASAMILPGVSGGYLLLLLGQYVPILSGLDAFQEALRARDASAALDPAAAVLLPVAIGVAVGIVGVSNLLRWLLARYEKATLGVLLGLLLGAVVGLWPFQETVPPTPGETVVRGEIVTEETLPLIAPEDYPAETFRPDGGRIAGALGLIVAGFAVTALIARLGGEKGGSQ
ncbi:MAG: DUF368 domain-containing protein [Candidatus Eisenbacteria bacterium]|nr:DUF368 domain-containing protein [Candidatus Latescibacterota bacterium]MBD3301518.1 DUF368 domain-containing protein [Candidatus Eisenbacteria bacterium]